ncbi:MAG: hypothetical protein ACK2UV_19920 [Candidatus Promineifilaceae bacterium]|jgi:hypothetical protein
MLAYLPLKFLQVDLHQEGGSPARLDLFADLLRQVDIRPVIGVELDEIKENGILILPTRQIYQPFEDWELDFITQFIAQGNPLFHLSNAFPWPVNDSILGKQFGYHFQSRVSGLNPDELFDIYPLPSPLNIFAPLDNKLHFSVLSTSIVTGDETFTVIADFKQSEIAYVGEQGPFGIGRSRDPVTGRGAIVALGDSGLLGRPIIPRAPGPGLRTGDNFELIKRIVIWLKNQAV